MRLVCPNCDAEYKVDESAIPDTGRDVQCSSCGHAWFQLPPEIELALEQEEELFGQPAASDPVPPIEPAATAPEPARRQMDDDLLAILREEAEREAAARKAEAAPLESQPDLGLTAPAAPAAGTAARRIAQMKGEPAPVAAAPRPAARRDLLPDIEEINSSLKGSDPLPQDSTETIAAAESRSFRSGFGLTLVLALLAAAVYTSAPRIVAHVPAAEASMTAYVGAVDRARLWLDGALKSATQAVRSLAGQDGTPTEG